HWASSPSRSWSDPRRVRRSASPPTTSRSNLTGQRCANRQVRSARSPTTTAECAHGLPKTTGPTAGLVQREGELADDVNDDERERFERWLEKFPLWPDLRPVDHAEFRSAMESL